MVFFSSYSNKMLIVIRTGQFEGVLQPDDPTIVGPLATLATAILTELPFVVTTSSMIKKAMTKM